MPPARCTRSSSRGPRQRTSAPQPSLAAKGSSTSTVGSASTSARLSAYGCGPVTSSCQSAAVADPTTWASSAVLLTGSPSGPRLGWRGASRPSGSSGVRVWPTTPTATMPTPAPAAASTPRREMPGVAGGGRSPALLCESGFSFQGISVSTSAAGSLARSP